MNNETSHTHENDSNKTVKNIDEINIKLKKNNSTSATENTVTEQIEVSTNNSVIKEKKYNGFLRNTNRKHKETDKEISPIPVIKNPPKNKSKFKNPNKPSVDKNIDFNQSISKEDLFSPEYLLFAHLRQKTGNNPNKFWENLYILLKEKEFKDIKRSDMSLISYAALYESTDIFETLLYDYGHLIERIEIEKSIFKISANKNPLILEHTINFYNKNYTPTEEFINEFIIVVGKFSYREEANKLFVTWLSKIMTDDNKNNFWKVCFENKNIPLMDVALNNYELNNYLKNNKDNFDELINNSCKKFTILSSIINKVNKDTSSLEAINIDDNIMLQKEFILKKEEEEILKSLKKQLPSINQKQVDKNNDYFIKNPAKKIKTTSSTNSIFFEPSKKTEINQPEIIIKKKRKVV